MVKPASQRAHHANLHPHHIRRKTAAVAVAACFTTGVAIANPTAPTVVHGTVSMSQAGGILNITNSHNAIINWGSFSIGASELTRFIQPSALSAVLNRVVGSDPSTILGALQSNGRVFLLNPNGIVFGSGAQINVAGLVASTLNLSNDDFLNNRMRFTDGAGAGSVVNQGNITGGSVYLIGNAVANKGLITSTNGEVVLAAGNSVELVSPGTPNLRVEVVAPANEAVNLGSISAEAGRVGIYAGLIKQGGTINADSAVAEGGRIMLKSTKSTALEAGSVTTARGTRGGQIVALSGMNDGKTEVAGKLDASAIASGTPGAGGFIETSAAKVKIADSAVINAAGSGGGKAGTWLIDPADFYISNAYGGDMSATLLSATLNSYGGGTNVDIESNSGFAGSTGTIFVNDAVSWSTDSTLRLIAVGNVDVNSAITNTGTGAVQLFSGWTGSYDLSPVPVPLIGPTAAPSQNINLNAPISTGGDIHLIAYGNIVQGAPGSLTASGLAAYSETGSVNLANASATNTVSTVAGRAIGQFAFKNSGNLTVGTVGGASGIAADGASPGVHATVNVDVTGGTLTVSNPILVTAAGGSGGAAGGNANISLSATNGMTINANLIATAGHGGSAFYGGTPGVGGTATINLTNTGSPSSALVIGNGVSVQAIGGGGGDSYGFYGGSVGARGGDAVVTLTSAGTITVEGQVRASGGHGGSGASGGRGGDGIITMAANGGDLSITSTGNVVASGGYSSLGDVAGGRGGDGSVALAAYGGLTVSGTVRANGGTGGSASAGAAGRGGDAIINLTAGTGMTGALNIDSTIANAVKAEGGEGGSGYWTGTGGRGGNATVNLTSSGAMTLGNVSTPYVSTAYALGGGGGRADGSEGMAGGDGGHGTVTASSAGGITVNAVLEARGGEAYLGSSGLNFRGRGGDAFINLSNTNTGVAGFAQTTSYGMTAEGGRGAVGGDASVSITSAAGIDVQSVYVYGGVGSSVTSALRRGGNALITMQNTNASAPLTINSSVSAYGGQIGGSGTGISHGGNASVVISSAGGIDHWGSINALGGTGDLSGNGGSAFIQLTATGGLGIRYQGDIYATGGAGGDAGNANAGVGGNAEIRLISSHGVDGGEFYSVQARGGQGGTVYAGVFNGGAGGSGTVVIQNTSTTAGVSIEGDITADGGEGGAGRGLGAIGGRGGDATIAISSSSNIDVFSSGYLSAQGGSGGYATSVYAGTFVAPISDPSAQGGRGGDASLSLTAAGSITVAGFEGLYVQAGRGGNGAQYFGYTGSGGSTFWNTHSGTGGRGGDAVATLQAGNGITFTGNVYLDVVGGQGGGNSTGTPEIYGNGGHANATLINTGSAPIIMNSIEGVYAGGGDGTIGGDATVVITSAGGISLTNGAYVEAFGGSGVNGGAGRGGSAGIQLTSTSASTGITIDGGEVYADGGYGGFSVSGSGGRGGDASVSVASSGGILVKRFVGASAGAGGSNSGFGAGDGGNASVTLTNTSSTAPIAVIRDYSTAYGIVGAEGGWGLTGGNAAIAMTSAAGFVLQQTSISAGGGTGYAESAATAAQGGTGSVVLTNTNAGAGITAENSLIYASGGSLSRGSGNGGNGGDAVVILSSAGGITLSNSFAGASGGNVNGSGGAPTDRGGAAGLTMLAGGNILIEGGEGSAWGGGGVTSGGNAAVNIIAGGNIQLEGGEGGIIHAHTLPSAVSSVVMAATGNLTINGGSVTSHGMVGLGGANILADQFAYVWGDTGVQVDASGSLTVNNNSMVGGNGIAKITTGGNVLVENSSMIAGNPDVILKVGGEIFMNTGGQIYAGAPTTIHLTFPMLTSGGFTVNGIPGLVFDGTTGFFAGGSGAVLGTNLLITYGGGAELIVPTDTLIVAMNDSVKPPDAEKKKDIFEDESSLKKKKEAPVCR